jgi:hypothetical protein
MIFNVDPIQMLSSIVRSVMRWLCPIPSITCIRIFIKFGIDDLC